VTVLSLRVYRRRNGFEGEGGYADLTRPRSGRIVVWPTVYVACGYRREM